MKLKFKNIVIALALAVLGSSCDSFLDVKPKGEVLSDDLFKDAKGFENALYGVYATMNSNELYGRNLSYYALDLMAQYFTSFANEDVTPVLQFDYKNQKVETRFFDIWCKMYTNISNVNNVLENLERFSPSSLEYYNIYKGEALGLRAFMHFDLLRIFSEQITQNSDADGIPYNTRFSLFAPDVLKAKDVYKRVIGDLRQAEELLNDEKQYESIVGEVKYLKDQNIHFNLQAVQATLARVYLTNNNVDSALYYAQKVINREKQTLLDFTEIDGDLEGILSSKETIFGVYSKTFATEVIEDLHKSISFFSLDLRYDISNLYQRNMVGNDYRWSAWFDHNASSKIYKLSKFTDTYVLNNREGSRPAEDVRGINLIRLPEMYYIAAECLLKKGNAPDALVYFNKVLVSRGLVALDERTPVETLTVERITEERYKEFVGEGQTFFNMKRLNLDVTNTEGKVIAASKSIYVVDIPAQEFEYRR